MSEVDKFEPKEFLETPFTVKQILNEIVEDEESLPFQLLQNSDDESDREKNATSSDDCYSSSENLFQKPVELNFFRRCQYFDKLSSVCMLCGKAGDAISSTAIADNIKCKRCEKWYHRNCLLFNDRDILLQRDDCLVCFFYENGFNSIHSSTLVAWNNRISSVIRKLHPMYSELNLAQNYLYGKQVQMKRFVPDRLDLAKEKLTEERLAPLSCTVLYGGAPSPFYDVNTLLRQRLLCACYLCVLIPDAVDFKTEIEKNYGAYFTSKSWYYAVISPDGRTFTEIPERPYIKMVCPDYLCRNACIETNSVIFSSVIDRDGTQRPIALPALYLRAFSLFKSKKQKNLGKTPKQLTLDFSQVDKLRIKFLQIQQQQQQKTLTTQFIMSSNKKRATTTQQQSTVADTKEISKPVAPEEEVEEEVEEVDAEMYNEFLQFKTNKKNLSDSAVPVILEEELEEEEEEALEEEKPATPAPTPTPKPSVRPVPAAKPSEPASTKTVPPTNNTTASSETKAPAIATPTEKKVTTKGAQAKEVVKKLLETDDDESDQKVNGTPQAVTEKTPAAATTPSPAATKTKTLIDDDDALPVSKPTERAKKSNPATEVSKTSSRTPSAPKAKSTKAKPASRSKVRFIEEEAEVDKEEDIVDNGDDLGEEGESVEDENDDDNNEENDRDEDDNPFENEGSDLDGFIAPDSAPVGRSTGSAKSKVELQKTKTRGGASKPSKVAAAIAKKGTKASLDDLTLDMSVAPKQGRETNKKGAASSSKSSKKENAATKTSKRKRDSESEETAGLPKTKRVASGESTKERSEKARNESDTVKREIMDTEFLSYCQLVVKRFAENPDSTVEDPIVELAKLPAKERHEQLGMLLSTVILSCPRSLSNELHKIKTNPLNTIVAGDEETRAKAFDSREVLQAKRLMYHYLAPLSNGKYAHTSNAKVVAKSKRVAPEEI